MAARNAARVFPEPVGAAIRVDRPSARAEPELPAEKPISRAVTAQPSGVDPLLMMRGAQDRQVVVLVTAAVRTVDDVVRVQVPAGRAARNAAAPAIALEDAVAPLPFRGALDVPGLLERVDHPGDALPVVQIASRHQPADPAAG